MKPRKRKCKVCRAWYRPQNSMQQVCSPLCAIEWTKLQAQRRQRDRDNHRLQQLKTRSDLTREAQTAFNEYIRERDQYLRCISCGRDTGAQWHAGHYLSTGSTPELRFNTYNCHKQCAHCNDHLSGNLIKYRRHLVKKIGLQRVQWLEGPHEAKHYSKDDLRRIKAIFKKKTKRLKRQPPERRFRKNHSRLR